MQTHPNEALGEAALPSAAVMHQQGGDSSTDKEVMAILSSPGQQKLVKPQPRPGGLATAAASLRMPSSPLANGKALPGPAAAAPGSSDYFSEMAVGGSGSGGRRLAEAALALEDSARNAGSGASPPRTPVLPKSTSASWDPQVQSSSSAFSVPAGRGTGRGGRSGASPGVGGMGGTGLRGLTLGGFRVVGGDTADPEVGDGQGHDRQGVGGGRTPGPTKGLRYPLDSTLGRNTLGGGVLREGKSSDVNANANAVEATRGGRGRYGLAHDEHRSDDTIFGGHGHQDHHARSLSDPYSAPHEALGNTRSIGGGGKVGTGNSSSGVGLGRRRYDMAGLSGPLEGGVSTTTRDTTSATSAAAAEAAVVAQQGYSMAKDEAEAMPRASESSSLDNWGILQYGLTLEGSMTDTTVDGGSGVGTGDAGGSDIRRSKEVPGGDSCGEEMGGGDSAGGNNGGDARRRGDPPLSSSSASVEVMMESLSLHERRYAREADPRKGVPSTTSRSLLYSGRGGVQVGDRSHTFMRARGRAEEDGMLADDYGLTTWPEAGCESNSDFSLLRAQRANYPSEREARASALHQQQQQLLQNQQANSAPIQSRRAIGGSPSLAPMRRRHPSSSGNLESESFPTAPEAITSERTATWHSGGGGGDGGVNDGSGAGSEPLHWSFPPQGMGGHAGGVPADGDVASGGNRLSGLEKDGEGSSGVDIGGGNGDKSGMKSGEVGEGHGEWGGMRSVLERDHGVSRRLVYGNASKGNGGGNGGDSDAELATQRDLPGSVEGLQFAMMRRQHQGIVEADDRMTSGGDNGGGEIIVGGDSRAPGQLQQYSLSQHPRFSKDSHQAALSASSDYDGRGITVDRGGTGGASVGGGCDVSGSAEHMHGSRVRMSVRHYGVRGGMGMAGAPPGFPTTAYEYAEYTAGSMEGHMANGGTISEDGRGVGHARRLPRDRPQQHEQQHMQDSLDEQQQHQRGGAPPSDHMQLRPTAGSRPLRGGGESMRSQPGGALLGSSEGHGWERGGRSEQGVGVSAGSSGEVDYADVYSTRRGAYGVSVGHRSSSGRQLGYDAGYDGHQGSGVQYGGGVNSGALYRGSSSSRTGGVDPSSRLVYENIDGGEETLSYDVGVGGGGASQGFSRKYNGLSMGGQSGGYDSALPQAGGDQSYRGGGGVRYSVADHEVSMGHRQQGSRDYQIHNEFQQQQQQPARPGFSPPDRKKSRANLGYSPPEHASLSSVLPRSQQQQQQQQYPQDELPWSSAHQIHLQQHHPRGPSPQSYHPSQQYSQQQQSMQVKTSSWSDSRAGLDIRSASGISGANYGSTSTARRVGGGSSAGHAAGQNISTGGGGVGASGSGIGDVYVRRRLPAPGPPSSEGALGKGSYGISSPRVNVGSGGAGTGGPGQQQLYSSSPSHAPIQDRRMQGVQQHQQQQQGFREASPLRGAMNGPPSSGLSVSMASGPAAPAPFSRSSSGPTSLPNSNKAHGLSTVGNVGAQVQSELGGVGSRGSSPHRPRMYPAEPPGLSAGAGRYGFVDGVSGGGVLSRGEGSIHRSISHGAGVQGGFGRPPRQQQQQQQYGVQPHVKGHMSHGPLHGTALRHPGGVGGGRGGGGAMVPVPGAPMDETQVKRAELVESPTTRLAFKDFYRAFRAKEKTSFHAAKMFAMECFNILPPKVHWRLYLEIADLARRENRFVEARELYQKVTKLQPFASQGWVEYCKLEEEFGDLSRCSQILRRGLTFCEYSETLLIKAVKQEERAGNLGGARELLSRLKHVGIDNVWRTVLEGALLEARSGNTDVARKVLKYLMTHVPWYGPIYYEAFRLEEKAEHFESALAIVERGLQEIPRYGPLWFGAFRLSEKLDMRDAKRALAEGQSPYAELYRAGKVCTRAKKTLEKAKDCISKELVWKVHFEAAQIEERLASVCAKEVASRSEMAAAAAAASTETLAKKDGVDKAKFSPQGMRSKNIGDAGSLSPRSTGGVGGGMSAISSDVAGESDAIISGQMRALSLQRKDSEIRLEASENEDWRASEREIEVISEAKARDSLLGPCRASYAYAVLSCPQNLRWKVWLAGARMELAAGNCSHAQRLLNRAFQEVPEKSKSHVFLECARLEEFTGNLDSARQILERARVETKSEWKVFLESVLLEIRANDWQRAAAEAQEALRVHSGAGRLWAVLVQLKQRDSDEAQQASLKQALKEVPKSGEVWCEGARIHLNPLSKAFDLDTAGKYLGFAVQFTPQYGDSFMECLRLGLLNDLFLPRAKEIADAWQKGSGFDSAAESSPVLEESKAPNDDAGSLGGLERGLDFMSGERSGVSENDTTCADGIDGRNGGSSDMVEGAGEQVGGVDCADITTADVSVKARPKKSERRLLSPEVWAAIDAGENIPIGSGGGRGVDGVVSSGTGMGTRTGTAVSRGEGNGGRLDSDDSSGSVKASGGICRDSEALDKAKGGGSAGAGVSGEGWRFKLSPREMAAASRVTEGDILRAHVEELLLRCVNADPNYGSMWFHCRHRPSDTAKSILMMAKVMMADELTKLQDVYLLAVTRHVILQREVDAYIVSSTVSTMSNPAEEATERTVRRRHRKGASRGRRQELAGERRERLLETAAKVAPPVGYDNPEGNLAGVRPEDFVTGLASLNRITAHMRRLRSEDRRKILFGSDQIVP